MPHQEEALREGSYICRFVCWQVHIFACADEQILCETWEERDNGGDGCCGEKVLGIEQRMCKY